MSIQSEITRLTAAKAGLKTAIEGKGVTVAADATLDAYPALVDSIEGGGGASGGIPVKFLNLITNEIMGTIYVEKDYALTAADFPVAPDLLETVDHPAFTFEKWSAAVGTVIKRPRTILAYYDKDDKTKNEYYCNAKAGQPIQLGVTDGSVVDWGDGSAVETFDSEAFVTHTYAAAGYYKVTMSGTLMCNLNYMHVACPFVRIYAGQSSVKFSSGKTYFQLLEYLYLKDATYVTSTGNRWFYESALRVVTLPAGSKLVSYQFWGCVGLRGVGLGSEIYTYQSSIASYVFGGCISLEDITLHCAPGEDMFEDCNSLKNVELLSASNIPSSCFNYCTSLGSIDLPSTVTSLAIYSFANCRSLKSISLPSGLTSIGTTSFQNCKMLKSIELPSGLTTLEDNVFKGCGSLEALEIPAGVTQLKSGVVSECRQLFNVTLHAGLVSVAELAGISVSSLVIPNTVTTIGPYALSYNYRLSSLTLPANLTSIPMSMCYNDMNLSEIDIPSGVTSIGMGAFGFESAPASFIRTIRMHSSTPAQLDSGAIPAIPGLRIIVPAGSLEAYQTAWSSLSSYIEEEAA